MPVNRALAVKEVSSKELLVIKDLHFNFVGFHGTDGYCHLRVAQKSSKKKMVIVCSQYKNYYGTSPTNAMELIAEKFFYDVANKNIEGFDLPKNFIKPPITTCTNIHQ